MKKYQIVLDRVKYHGSPVASMEITKFEDVYLKEVIECDKVATDGGCLLFTIDGAFVAYFSQGSWLYFKLVE